MMFPAVLQHIDIVRGVTTARSNICEMNNINSLSKKNQSRVAFEENKMCKS